MNQNPDQEKLLEGHTYDGIQELDNSLPTWWLVIFFATIIFSFIYYIHYEFGGGASPAQELEASMKQLQALNKGGPVLSEEKLASSFTDDFVAAGKLSFEAKCSVCHGPVGQGLIGPNLTDNFWIHGKGTRVDIFQTIGQGVPQKGMPSWKEQMGEQELIQVSAYVYTLKGKMVPGGKDAQGTEYP